MLPTLKSKTLPLLAAVALAGSLSACGKSKDSTTGSKYPSEVTTSFKTSCVTAAKGGEAKGGFTDAQAAKYCDLALACLESHLTLDQFKTYVSNVQSGDKNPSAKVVQSCIQESVVKAKQS